LPPLLEGDNPHPGRPSNRPDPSRALYDMVVCGPSRNDAVNGYGDNLSTLTPSNPISAAADADTVVVPGVTGYAEPPPQPVLDLLRDAHARRARIASICTGAFVLAAAGLLDGRRVTTHWAVAGELAARYPRVQVDPSVLYVDNGDILTSAGMAAGLDMCLHMVRRDHGAAAAADLARVMVVPLERDGGQAQFIARSEPAAHDSIAATLVWLQADLARPVRLADIARHANVSVRTLNRRFREHTGTTAQQWLIRQRLYRAQQLLETTSAAVEEVARLSGFGTAIALRQHFGRVLPTSPLAYRRSFQAASTTPERRDASASSSR
jgi:transcriptional regulator GlxA family with amidase domain